MAPNFEEIFICGHCFEVFDQPTRLRDCPHVFCRRCLEPLVSDDRITCPECGVETNLPEGGLDDLHADLNLERMVESLLCVDCKTIDRYTRTCDFCFVQSCHNCILSHDSQEKCDLRRSMRTLEEELPVEELVTKKEEWEAFKEKNQSQKKELDENLTKQIDALQTKKENLLKKFDEYDQFVQKNIDVIEQTIQIEQYLDNLKNILEEMDIPALIQAQSEMALNHEAVSKKHQILSEPIPEYLGTVWIPRLSLEVAHVGEQILRRKAGEDAQTDMIWSTDEGAVWCETGYCSSRQLASGQIKLFHHREGRYELVVMNKKKILKTFSWDKNTSGRYLEDRHWIHIPWCLRTPDGKESSRYSTRIEDKNARCAFAHAMMHTLKNDME